MKIPQLDKDIQRIWFQVDSENTDIEFVVSDYSQQFDVALETNLGGGIYSWDLATLNAGIISDELVLGKLNLDSQDSKEIEFQYQLASLDEIISSGTIATKYNPIPKNTSLGKAYPNPFNPVAKLSYGLSKNSYMTLSIYDIMGREISNLVDGVQLSGYYEINWDAADYASGIYFIHMNVYGGDNTSQFNEIQRIVLVK